MYPCVHAHGCENYRHLAFFVCGDSPQPLVKRKSKEEKRKEEKGRGAARRVGSCSSRVFGMPLVLPLLIIMVRRFMVEGGRKGAPLVHRRTVQFVCLLR